MKTTREATASALISLEYKIDRSWHFMARSGERTPSAYINDDGSIHDFGDGWHGDLADFLCEFHRMGKGEALREARRLLDLPVNVDFSSYEKRTTDKKNGFIDEKFIKPFEHERKSNFGRYSELLEQLMPSLTRDKQREMAKKYNIGYSIKADRLIMPIRDDKGNCVTLWKYNKYPTPFVKDGETVTSSKVTFTKGRDRCPFNLVDLKKYHEDLDGWIFLCEGEKDCLNALARGYRAVTLGSASAKIDENHLHLFKSLKIIVVYDYDEAGKKGVYGYENNQQQYVPGILSQLEQVAESVKVWDWELLALQQGFELFKGFDLTDWFCLKNPL